MAAPIVIIGAARSGTVFLRNVLAASPAARAVPYDVNYVWRFQAGAQPDDALPLESLTFEKRDFIQGTLPSLAGIARGEDDTALVENTVGNALRVPFVASVLPNAQFVHLVRDGRDVTESAMRMWRTPSDKGTLLAKLRGLPLSNIGYLLWSAGNAAKDLLSGSSGPKIWGPRYPGIEEDAAQLSLARVCARQWLHSITAARRDLADLPPERVHEIRYEALMRSPGPLTWLLERLGLPGADDVLNAYHTQVRPRAQGAWRKAMNRDDQKTMLGEIGPALDRLGYTD